MIRIVLFMFLLAVLPSVAEAYDVLILQSRRDLSYEEALSGFRAVSAASRRVIILSDYAETDVVRIVREDRPRLIVAVGDAALTAARKVQGPPVIALMSLGIHSQNGSQDPVSGIGMFAAPEYYMTIFKTIKSRRVGVIHNPDKTGWYLLQARQAADRAGIELVVREVSSPRDTPKQLSRLAGKVNALWMLPDITAVTRETAEAYFLFGQTNGVPVISFASSYLGLGAAAVVEIDRSEAGRQAAEMAGAILTKGRTGEMVIGAPRKVSLKTNPGILKRLGPEFEGLKNVTLH